ncbi:SRPBCC family protein [Streptomyces hoynatensis]|uniref:SRPBCC domain-containing protein n=1 Tax=Streptomyces hoynatensis TaxID=1141874 RepID=A0A3A9YXR5_9ACTN|nr:SRPBCC domain-containing protein [Streptomyces hoynatensis]RKN40434.1 SRPBCC domain-containing protein [Streptomyces hoynatensis]
MSEESKDAAAQGEFEIVREFEVAASPEQVWDAITTGTAGWLWPMEYEPREGGQAPFGGTVVAWDPPRRLTARSEDVSQEQRAQTFNQLDHLIQPREGGGCRVRYVHSGIFVEDWDNQYEGADKHTDFYLHTLRQYLEHFPGRQAAFATFDAPGASVSPGALERVSRALGLPDEGAEGERAVVALPGAGEAEAVVDYRNRYFLGLRTGQAMYRVFGRHHFGAPVGVSIHQFAPDADVAKEQAAWQEFLGGLFS